MRNASRDSSINEAIRVAKEVNSAFGIVTATPDSTSKTFQTPLTSKMVKLSSQKDMIEDTRHQNYQQRLAKFHLQP
jgi:hypothetical protein